MTWKTAERVLYFLLTERRQRVAANGDAERGENATRDTQEVAALGCAVATVDAFREAVREFVARHDRMAVNANFLACGCAECKPFRELLDKTAGV